MHFGTTLEIKDGKSHFQEGFVRPWIWARVLSPFFKGDRIGQSPDSTKCVLKTGLYAANLVEHVFMILVCL